MSAPPLDGVKVLDCTQFMAGPYCTLILADMGADVVKVERLQGGDDTRRSAPTINEVSSQFLMINRNKRSIALDLKAPEGKETFKRLAKGSDVVVQNFRPGTMEELGLGYKDLKPLNDALIYCSISGFGQTGPYAHRGGFDLVAQGMSGIMSVTGIPDGPPIKVGVPITDLAAGMYGANGVMAAYIHRLKTGQGQHVDTSLLEAGIALTVWETGVLWATGESPYPMGSAHRINAPYQALRCMDQPITIGAANQANWERLCNAMDREELREDPRFETGPLRRQNYEELAEELEKTLLTRPADYWLPKLEEEGVPSGPLNDMAQVYQDPHVLDRDMVVELDHPTVGRVRAIGIPVKLSESPGAIRRPAPLLGQHTQEVLREHGFSDGEVAHLLESGVVRAPT